MRMIHLYAKWKGYKHISVYSFLPVLKYMLVVNNKSYEIMKLFAIIKHLCIGTCKNIAYSFYIFFINIMLAILNRGKYWY